MKKIKKRATKDDIQKQASYTEYQIMNIQYKLDALINLLIKKTAITNKELNEVFSDLVLTDSRFHQIKWANQAQLQEQDARTIIGFFRKCFTKETFDIQLVNIEKGAAEETYASGQLAFKDDPGLLIPWTLKKVNGQEVIGLYVQDEDQEYEIDAFCKTIKEKAEKSEDNKSE